MADLATKIAPRRTALPDTSRDPVLQVAVFSTSVDILRNYAKWARGSQPHQGVAVETCLLDQDPAHRDATLAELVRLGFEADSTHILEDDGVRDPDLYVDPYDGGIGVEGAYAVSNLGNKALYLFDNISVTDWNGPAKDKLHKLMRLLAGIPKQRGFAVLFDRRQDRVCFSQYCISSLSAHQRDKVLSEALLALRERSQG